MYFLGQFLDQDQCASLVPPVAILTGFMIALAIVCTGRPKPGHRK